MTRTRPGSRSSRPLWAALMVLIAATVGAVAGVLRGIDGATVPSAVLAGAGAFASTLLVLLAVVRYLDGRAS